MPYYDTSYVALARPHTYTFTFHPWELWEWEIYSQTFTYDETWTLTPNTFTRLGYHFSWRWATEASAQNKDLLYEDEHEFYNLTSTDNAQYHLYAIREPNTQTPYTIQYALEDLEWNYVIQTQDTKYLSWITDTTVIAPLNTYVWFNAPNEVEINIDPDGLKVHTYEYERKTITLSFDTQWWTEIESFTGKYEAEIQRPADPLKRGYTFNWWTPEIPETFQSGDQHFTAWWTLNIYPLHYELNGWEREVIELQDEENTEEPTPQYQIKNNPSSYSVESKSIILNNPIREWYTFRWWTGYIIVHTRDETYQDRVDQRLELEGTTSMIIPESSIWERYFFADWQANTDTAYTVLHRLQSLEDETLFELTGTDNLYWETDTTITPSTNTYEWFTEPELQSKNIEPDGSTTFIYDYTRNSYDIHINQWVGVSEIIWKTTYKYQEPVSLALVALPWYTVLGFTGDYETSEFNMPANDVYLDTLTSLNTYTITYNLDWWYLPIQDEVQLTNPETYTVEDETITLNNPEKVGYYFIWWTWTAIEDWTTTVEIPQGSIGDRTYTALYEPNTDTQYEVYYRKQDINSDTYTIAYSYTWYGTSDTEVTPEVPVYEWFEEIAEQTQTIAPDGSTVFNFYYPRKSYVLTIDRVNDEPIIQQTLQYEENIPYPSTPEKTGFTFLWRTQSPVTMPADHLNIYAQRERNAYTLSRDPNGGTFEDWVSSEIESYPLYEDTIYVPLINRVGYTFQWWNPVLPTSMPAENTWSRA